MNDTKKNIDLSIVPDQEINTKEIFGIECPFKVCGFKSKNDHVPIIDKDYKFDPETTRAILAGFADNRRVIIQGYHGTGKSTHI